MNRMLTIVACSCGAVLALAGCDSGSGQKGVTTVRTAATADLMEDDTSSATVQGGSTSTDSPESSSTTTSGPYSSDVTTDLVPESLGSSNTSEARLITFKEPGGLASQLPAAELVVMDGCFGLRTPERSWQPIAWPDEAELAADGVTVSLGSIEYVVGGIADYGGGAVEISAADRIEPGMLARLEACAFGETTFWAVKP